MERLFELSKLLNCLSLYVIVHPHQNLGDNTIFGGLDALMALPLDQATRIPEKLGFGLKLRVLRDICAVIHSCRLNLQQRRVALTRRDSSVLNCNTLF